MMLDRAPVPAVERIRTDEVDGAGDVASGALSHHQQDALAHRLADQRIERPREIRPPPLARPGLHVEREERVPGRFREAGAGEPFDLDAGCQRVLAFAPDGLALARGERAEEILERAVALVLPVELLIGALEEAALAEQAPFFGGRERDVDRQ